MRRLIVPIVWIAVSATSAAAQRDSAFSWSKTLPAGARLTIRNLNGPIDIRATSGTQVQVHATVRAEGRGSVREAEVEVRERSANDVEICSVYRKVSACDGNANYNSWNDDRVSVHYTIDVPKALFLTAGTGNGDLTITRTAAEVDGTTGNGDVNVVETTGRVGARTGNGDVAVNGAQGPVRASTGNGRVTATAAGGSMDVSSGNGDVDVRMRSVPADTKTMSFTTGNGNIRLTLPADFSGEIDANSAGGSVTTDFDIRATGRFDSSRLRGTIGSGQGPLLKMRTGAGRLELKKGS